VTFQVAIKELATSGYNPWENAEKYEKKIEDRVNFEEQFVEPWIKDITHRGEVTIMFNEPVKLNSNLTEIEEMMNIMVVREAEGRGVENRTEEIEMWGVLD